MTVFNFISLFGGLALFLYGMRLMSRGLEQGSSGALKSAMEKLTTSPVGAFFLGLIATAAIQSSTATIVLTSGLVAAGIISLHQSLGIIIGANVGTTVTGQIIRLLDLNATSASWLNLFKPDTLAPIAAIVGILLIMAFRFRSAQRTGTIVMGFAILFTGLVNMTGAVKPLSESAAFGRLFLTLADKPVLGYLAGMAVAFSIQSSSAAVGILQALSTTGALSFSSVYSVIIGIYLGDCVTTAIVCSVGARADAKRTGIVHILFNLSGTVLVLVVVAILHRLGVFGSFWAAPITSGGIANTHTVFKLAGAAVLLPVCTVFEKLSRKIIPDDKVSPRRDELDLQALDDNLFEAPELALAAVKKIVAEMASLAAENVRRGFSTLMEFDQEAIDRVGEDEDLIDSLADHAGDYMVRLSPHLGAGRASDRLSYYIKCVDEFERIGDHAVNLTESASELHSRELRFSPGAQEELRLLRELIQEILDKAGKAFLDGDRAEAFRIEPMEEVVDELVAMMRNRHLLRLRTGECSVSDGFIFQDILVNAERISDQCSNIGVHTLSLVDAAVAAMEHDYILHLHQGENEAYNAEYAAVRKRYLARLTGAENEEIK
jgi:Na+/phosphate symporter